MDGLMVAASVMAGLSGAGFARGFCRRKDESRRIRDLRIASGVDGQFGGASFASAGASAMLLRYAVHLQQRISSGATHAVIGRLIKMPVAVGARIERDLAHAGCRGLIDAATVTEAGLRLATAGALGGAFLGSLISNEAVFALGVAGLVGGPFSLRKAFAEERQERVEQLERELPEMLEIVGLCLRSGMTFDRGLSVYTRHFDSAFSRACASALRQWELGLGNREQALRDLAEAYPSALFRSSIESIVRSLKLGVPLAEPLRMIAAEARAQYKAKCEERVAKAPVKMMIPTGTLILPAMLLFVLGPVLLGLIG